MRETTPKQIIEALLFASDRPLSPESIKEALSEATVDIPAVIKELNDEYITEKRSFEIREIASGYQMVTDPVYCQWISRLTKKPPERLTGAALETLAIVAYRQPITKSEISAIRGVNVDGVLCTLEEKGLVRTRGRKEAVGRPILYGTTNEFLELFGLKSLEELPQLKEFKEADLDFVKEMELRNKKLAMKPGEKTE